MTQQPRRTRHSELETAAHLHQHDDDLDTIDRAIGGLDLKLDRILWALVTATISGAVATGLWAVQVSSQR